MPRIYTWRNRPKYYRWYRELNNIEKERLEHPQPERVKSVRADLDRIEKAVSDIRVSVGF